MTDAKPSDDFRRLAVSLKPDDYSLVMKLKRALEDKTDKPVSLAEVMREACRCLAEREGVA